MTESGFMPLIVVDAWRKLELLYVNVSSQILGHFSDFSCLLTFVFSSFFVCFLLVCYLVDKAVYQSAFECRFTFCIMSCHTV